MSIKNSNLVRVIYYNNQIVACGFYSVRLKGNKLMYGGAVRGELHEIGKQAFDALIHIDVEHFEEYNWCEASGSVEKAFKQHNAFMLPNKYISQVLKKDYPLCNDGYHYERKFDNEIVQKMIFGFISEELLNTISNECFSQLIRDVKNTYEKLRAIQNLKEEKELNTFDEKNRPADLQYAYYLLNHIDEYVGYTNTYDIPIILIDYLKYARNVIANYSNMFNSAKRELIVTDDLLKVLQPLKIISKKAVEIINIENMT